MVKKLLVLVVICIFSVIETNAQNYVGIGGTYVMPLGNFKEVNQSTIGYSAHIMSKKYCKMWYGVKLDYFSSDSSSDVLPPNTHFTNLLTISPEVRYNFIPDDCGKYDLVPYANILLSMSSLGNTDELSRLGLGLSLGGGAAYSFNFMDRCMMIDLNLLYASPNLILRADGRNNLNYINVGLSLSVAL
jgi:hypothetical protein